MQNRMPASWKENIRTAEQYHNYRGELYEGDEYWEVASSPEEEDSFERHCYKIASELARMVIDKQRDYGTENILAFEEKGIVVRMNDKIARLKNLVWGNRIPNNETLDDTYRDLAGYSIVALMLRSGTFQLPLETSASWIREEESLNDTMAKKFTVECKACGGQLNKHGRCRDCGVENG
jgi:hypothetical protein